MKLPRLSKLMRDTKAKIKREKLTVVAFAALMGCNNRQQMEQWLDLVNKPLGEMTLKIAEWTYGKVISAKPK